MNMKLPKSNWVNTVLLAVVAYLLLEPNGPLGSRIVDWRQVAAVEEAARGRWERLRSVGTPLHEDEREVLAIEIIDYQCPYCRASHSTLVDFLARHPTGTISILHYPLDIHAQARFGSRIAICASEQGQMARAHDWLLSFEEWMEPTDSIAANVASALAIDDAEEFKACVYNPETERKLDAQIQVVKGLGVDATPVIIGALGQHIGAFGVDDIEAVSGLAD